MKHWLLKTEPSTFGVDDLEAAPRHTTRWDGVRNYQARNFIRDQMREGDQAFLYHSSCALPGIAAIVHLASDPYADPTAFDRRDPHYDPLATRQAPRWFTVDVRLQRRLERVITLDELRTHAHDRLSGMLILRTGSRLSVTPVEDHHWRFILSLE